MSTVNRIRSTSFKKRMRMAGSRVIGCALVCAMTFANSLPTLAAEPVTVFLLDTKFRPVVRLEKLSPPLAEGLRAILAMYALQNGAGCGEAGPNGKLDCVLTTALGVGPQCSDAQLQLVHAWFKSVPRMSGAVTDHNDYVDVQRPGSLKDLCHINPNTATDQQTWDRIRVAQDGGEVFIDATGSWITNEDTGEFRYKTRYRIEGRSISTLSHDVKVRKQSVAEE
jgi:hypothetical protein